MFLGGEVSWRESVAGRYVEWRGSHRSEGRGIEDRVDSGVEISRQISVMDTFAQSSFRD